MSLLTLVNHPKEWENEDRMNHLYVPFRKRELNPVGYDSKMKFWRNAIDNCLKDCGCCTFTLEELEKAFVRNGRKPMCLKEVIDNILSEGEISFQLDFNALVPSEESWTSWAVKNFVSVPVKWSFGRLKNAILTPPSIDYDKRFVLLSAVKNKANELLSKINDDLRGVVLTMDDVININKDSISVRDLDVVLHWLELEGLAAVMTSGDKTLVKFAQNGKKIEQISEADKAVFSLQQNKKQLMTSIENLESQRQDVILEAKNYLKQGMRPMAKSCLRRKKEIEKQIDKHVSALDNIHLLITRIHDTNSNSKVFEAYKVSLSAMKTQFKEVGLSEDNVSDTMAQVQEVLDIHDDIQSMLGEPVSNTVTSDEDFESELEDILKKKESEQIGNDFDLNELDLPEPPTHSPKYENNDGKRSKESKNVQQALSI